MLSTFAHLVLETIGKKKRTMKTTGLPQQRINEIMKISHERELLVPFWFKQVASIPKRLLSIPG